jgi:hypothetical protein
VANSHGQICAVDPPTGTYAPFAEVSDSVMLEPVVANKTLYILDNSGRITAYR